MDIVVTGTAVASPAVDSGADMLASTRRGPVDFDPRALLGGRGLRYKDRASLLGMLAARMALVDSRLMPAQAGQVVAVPGRSVGVVVSSNLGNLDTVCGTAEVIATKSVKAISPMALPNASSNVVASSIAVRFGLRGPNVMVTNGLSSGLDAIWLAAMLIRAGRVSCAVVVGVEPDNEVVRRFLKGAKPRFDGAAAVVLEASDSAARRLVAPRAVIGRFIRTDTWHGCVVDAMGTGTIRIGLWLAPRAALGWSAIADARRHDLDDAACCGALGVLQVVAGTSWLAAGTGAVLATAGAPDDGISSLLLTQPPGPDGDG